MAQDRDSVIVDHTTVFPHSRPGLKTLLITVVIIGAIVFGIYWPVIKAAVGIN
jgi:hypothetical protein